MSYNSRMNPDDTKYFDALLARRHQGVAATREDALSGPEGNSRGL